MCRQLPRDQAWCRPATNWIQVVFALHDYQISIKFLNPVRTWYFRCRQCCNAAPGDIISATNQVYIMSVALRGPANFTLRYIQGIVITFFFLSFKKEFFPSRKFILSFRLNIKSTTKTASSTMEWEWGNNWTDWSRKRNRQYMGAGCAKTATKSFSKFRSTFTKSMVRYHTHCAVIFEPGMK